MGTHATIGIIRKDGRVSTVTLVNDGYLSHAGRILMQHYNSRNAARILVSLGTISVLAHKLQDTITHHVHFQRDIDKGNEFPSYNAFMEYRKQCAHDNLYLYDERAYCDSPYETQYNYETGSTGSEPHCYWYYVPECELIQLRETAGMPDLD